MQLLGVGAVRAVHADSPALGNEAKDLVPRYWGATLRQLRREVCLPLHQNSRAVATPLLRSIRDLRGGRAGLQNIVRLGLRLQALNQAVTHVARGDLSPTNRRVQRINIRIVQVAGKHPQGFVGEQSVHCQPAALRLGRQHVATLLRRFFPPFLGEPLADLRLRPGRYDDVHPVLRRPGVLILRGKHLHLVASLQLRFQRHQLAVDLRTNAAVADLRMHGVGEVDGRGPVRQRNRIALRREHENLVRR